MSTTPLEGLLRRAGRLVLWSELGKVGLRAAAGLIVLLLVVVGIDAAFGLPPVGLIGLDALLAAALLAALGWLGVTGYRQRYRPARMARLLEQEAVVTDSRLINAWQLAAGGAVAASGSLREQAIALGHQAAQAVPLGRVVDRRGLRLAAQGSCAAGLVLIAVWVLLPGVFEAVVPRLAQPMAHHPPFTLLSFQVRTEPQRILFGDHAAIRAQLTGPSLPHRVDVVFVDEHREPVQRLPMLRTAGQSRYEEHPTSARASTVTARASNSAAAGHFLLRLNRVEQSRSFYIDTPEGRSHFHELTVHPVPRFDRVHVRYEYPAYTGWEQGVEPLSEGGLRALEGTQVTVAVTSNVPLRGGTLKLLPTNEKDQDEATNPFATAKLAPRSDDPAQGTVRFALERSGRFELSLIGADGTPGYRTLRGQMVAVEDRKPRVSFTEPRPRTLAPVGWTVEVKVALQDDIGLDRLELYRGVNGWGPHATTLPYTPLDDAGRRAEASTRFDLAALGAQPGDVITYYAAAYDNHPQGGQLAESEIYSIEVVSMEEYKEYQRTRYRIDDIAEEWAAFEAKLGELEAQRNALLEQLEKLQQQMESGSPLSDVQRQQMRELTRQLDAYRQEALDLFFEMRERTEQATLYDFENVYKDRLRQIGAALQAQGGGADGVRRAMENLLRQAPSGTAPSAASRQALTKQIEQFAGQQRPFTEQDREQRQFTSEDLKKLQLADELMAQGERIRLVASEQKELAQRLAAYRHQERLGPSEQLRANELAERQAALRQELAEATAALKQTAEQANDLLPRMSAGARAIAEKAESLRITEDQQAAAQLALAGEGRYAHQAARSAAEKLDSLLSDTGGMDQQASNDLDGCFQLPRPGLNRSLSQMAQARGVPGLGMGQQGQSGYGLSGSMARMGIVGPAAPPEEGGSSQSDRNTAGKQGDGRGKQGEGADEGQAGAETVTPDQTTAREGAAAMPGVPHAYRGAAEAYFKRLADESD